MIALALWSGARKEHAMRFFARCARIPLLAFLVLAMGGTALALWPSNRSALADALPLKQLSSDPYSDAAFQHQTEAEPATFAFGSTVVSAFQAGIGEDTGAENIGFVTSQDGGQTWMHGVLSGTTTVAGGIYSSIVDSAVAFDARHSVWLISDMGQTNNDGIPGGYAILINRSLDGGHTFLAANTVAASTNSQIYDKDWLNCDNSPGSPFFGRCYSGWSLAETANGLTLSIAFSTSSDGGATWSPLVVVPVAAEAAQIEVQPDGKVIVPAVALNSQLQATSIIAMASADGGATWGSSVTVTPTFFHPVAGNLRADVIPTAGIDKYGKVYLVWPDCRFESGCSANDLVLSTTSNGTVWTAVSRIPIERVGSGVDHFIPGLAVDTATGGAGARLALVYYFFPNAGCTSATCQLEVGLVTSHTGGQTWKGPTQLAGPMQLAWIPSTVSGLMTGDYLSAAFAAPTAAAEALDEVSILPVFSVARAPSGILFNQAIYTLRPAEAAALAG